MQYFIVDITKSQQYITNVPEHISSTTNIEEADAILVFGGDGAMLHTIHSLRSHNIPFIGVNAGTRGFLMNNTEAPEHIWDRLGEVEFQALWFLEGLVTTNKIEKTIYGFNDIWVERSTGQTLRMEVTIDGEKQPGSLVGDGILFCTPQGSTGYNLSMRGKPISPGVPVLQVTPMSAVLNKSPLGSVILSDQSVITVNFMHTDKRSGRVYFDGLEMDLGTVERITINKSRRFVRLGFIEEYSIRKKVLSWQFQT